MSGRFLFAQSQQPKHLVNYEKVDFDNAIVQMQAQMAEVKQLLREERERSDKLRRQCYNQETLICKIPFKQ